MDIDVSQLITIAYHTLVQIHTVLKSVLPLFMETHHKLGGSSFKDEKMFDFILEGLLPTASASCKNSAKDIITGLEALAYDLKHGYTYELMVETGLTLLTTLETIFVCLGAQ